MSRPYPATADDIGSFRADPGLPPTASPASAVSWGAILAGTAAAAALSLILLMLGVGLGLSSVSPWARDGVSATTFGTSTVVWITVTQLAASAFGGYLAGRLRHRWANTHTDEVYFRDTAHGFLAWAIASLVTVTLLASAVGSILSGGAQVVGTAATAGAQLVAKTDSADTSMGYFVDTLFRKESKDGEVAQAEPVSAAPLVEVGRIFASNLQSATLPPADARYVGQLVAQRTGLPQADAEKRVNTVYAQMQAQLQTAKATALEAVEKSRKLSAYAALWLFIALLMGAFVASWVATYGGRQRDL
ncbi:hypothetical protein [Rhodoferax sp.]|uniref:hypothetical protein n=1 Tax=Rhodoferax sp. TaxID=50421 RepID=UPI0025DA6953|nr:hypothetical protein [Rhodoferax sp.]